MKCKHRDENDYALADFFLRDGTKAGPHESIFVHHMICSRCKEWLPLGPANDDDERVRCEKDAAERAAFNRETKYRPGYDRFDFCVDTKSGELCALCEALYLVTFINDDAMHNQGEGT